MNCLNNSLVEGRVGVRAQETVGEYVGVLVPLMRSPGRSPASSSSPPGGGLWRGLRQMRSLAIA